MAQLVLPSRRAAARRLRRPPRVAAFALAGALAAALAAPAALAGPVERAQEAQARGDLRAAQIEWRNAVRADPRSAAVRAALAAVSLDLFDGDSAEREARAALERGFDPVAGTALLLRSYAVRGQHRELLRDFPAPQDGAAAPSQPAAVGGLVAAARAVAQLALGQRDEARRSVADALRLAPQAVEPQLAAAALAEADGDRAAAEAAVDRALAIDPADPRALLGKAGQRGRGGDLRAAVEIYGGLIARMPGSLMARLGRAAALIQLGDDAAARQDVDAALRLAPNSGHAIYLRAALLVRARDWRGADAALQSIDRILGNFDDGYLLLATTKGALGQVAQAEDAARRQVARRPEDPRGFKLLAALEMQAGRPDAAAGTLARLDARGAADAQALDMLGRAHLAAGRPREAAAVLQRAAALAPNDAGILSRLAAVRLATGDVSGSEQAMQQTLRLEPERRGAHETLVAAALARGDVAAAEAELGHLDPAARSGAAARLLEGTIRLVRLDTDGAQAIFEAVLRDDPASVPARVALARVAAMRGDGALAVRLLGEILQRAPGNADAITRLTAAALAGGPDGAAARAALEAAQAAAPGEPVLAMAFAAVLLRAGEAARAVEVLNVDALRGRGRGAALPIARAQAYAAAGRWAGAEAEARAAIAEDANATQARQLLASFLLRADDARTAESVLRDGLRLRPKDPGLQHALVGLVLRAQGMDAALALADELARQPSAQPASRVLRGELLLSAQRPEEAARAFAAAFAEAPSGELAQRAARAWSGAGRADEAAAVLDAWLARDPADAAALSLRAQYDIQAGRLAEAETRLTEAAARAPNNAVVLNNLAWVLAARDGADMARAQDLAERAYFLGPSAQTADTLGWILTRRGEPARAVPLLRQAVSAPRPAQAGPDPGMSYRLAVALRAAGQNDEALRVLEPALSGDAPFAERRDAARLLGELRAGPR